MKIRENVGEATINRKIFSAKNKNERKQETENSTEKVFGPFYFRQSAIMTYGPRPIESTSQKPT